MHVLLKCFVRKTQYTHVKSMQHHNAADVLSRQSHCKQKCLQFMSECFDSNVWGSKISRKTVPCPRTLYGETAAAVIRPGSWNSQSTRVCIQGGSKKVRCCTVIDISIARQ